MPPIPPARPPMPTTEPTACFGNMSEAVVKMLADQPWWAAAARLTRPTATHTDFACEAKTIGTTPSAQASIVVLRAALTLQPRSRRAPDNQPPATLPSYETTYTTATGRPLPLRSSP